MSPSTASSICKFLARELSELAQDKPHLDLYQVLQDNCDKMTAKMKERVANGELSPEEAECRRGQICDGLSTESDESDAFWNGFGKGAGDGFVVTTNTAAQTITFGLAGYSLEELAEGGHLHDPNNPDLAVSEFMGGVAGASLPIGTAGAAVARMLRNTAVIGQNMARVRAFTSIVGGKNFGQAMNGAAWNTSTGPALNAFWVLNHIHDGNRFIDLGSGVIRSLKGIMSPYYKMELDILNDFGVRPVGVLWL
jgi:hypothetical protein